MIDCHSHLADHQFSTDVDELIQAAKEAGVKRCIALPESFDQFNDVIKLYERHTDFIAPGLGIHPVQKGASGRYDRSAVIADWTNEIRDVILKYQDQIVCIGECGLDFTPRYLSDEDQKMDQRQILKTQVDLANQLSLPLNLHSRSAGRHVIDILAECGAQRALLHAFDAKVSTALRGVELGFYFSIPPSVVRSPQKQKLVEKIPIENLLLETDAPALGPDSQARNEPKNLVISAEYIAKVKNIDVERVVEITSRNARSLFPRL